MTRSLEQRIAELSEEIRRYPTPIARCDEQLTALIEERSLLLNSLDNSQNPGSGCTPDAIWINDGGFDAA
ncbi:MAG: hypothetical protein AB1452_03975 [Pseudomonadota bacterium]